MDIYIMQTFLIWSIYVIGFILGAFLVKEALDEREYTDDK